MPLLSIVIPIYNSEEYLQRCMESIFSQKDCDYELILVDDGSTDQSGIIADSYRRENVKVIHKPNGGAASARQAGLEIARGEYVWFVDSDDAIVKNALSSVSNILRKTQTDILQFGVRYFNGSQYSSLGILCPEGNYSEKALEALKHNIIKQSGRRFLSQCFHIFRREMLSTVPFVSERKVHEEDRIFCILAYLEAKSFCCYAEYFYSYYKHKGSLSYSGEPALNKCLNAYTFLREEMKRRGVWESYQAEVAQSYLFDSLLGSEQDYSGCFFMEFALNRTNAPEVVQQALESEAIKEMVLLTQDTEKSPTGEFLYQIVKNQDGFALFKYLFRKILPQNTQ